MNFILIKPIFLEIDKKVMLLKNFIYLSNNFDITLILFFNKNKKII